MINPHTVKALIEWFEEDFECFVGPPKAYFTLPLDQSRQHCKYKAYALGAFAPNTEADLVHQFEDTFKRIAELPCDYRKHLVWRYPEKILFESEEVPIKGNLLCTKEQVQDGLLTPGPFAIQDFDSGSWFEKVGKTTQMRVYTRLCIPYLESLDHFPVYLEHNEGQKLRYIDGH